MRASIKNYIEAAKKRREETGEGGFSLIELIVVVAILGVLVAIAIPVFGTIQQTAKDNALKTAAANAATQVAAQVASNETVSTTNLSEGGKIKFVLAPTAPTSATIGTLCVTATAEAGSSMSGAVEQKAGPGCTTTP